MLSSYFKPHTKRLLQALLGFDRYLYWFAVVSSFRAPEPEFDHFLDFVTPDGTFLDIGANVGTTSIIAHRRYPEMRIIAFEPAPYNVRALRAVNRRLNVGAEIVETALGNTTAEIKMVLPIVKGVSMQGLSHVLDPALSSYNDGPVFSVPMITLDSLEFKNICGIKLDVENFESYVLEGGRATIQRDKPPIYCELWHNEQRAMTLDVAASLGYRPFLSRDRRLIPFTGQKALNFVLLPETARSRSRGWSGAL